MNPTSRRLIAYVGTNNLRDIADPSLRGMVRTFCEKQEKEVRELLACNTSVGDICSLLRVFKNPVVKKAEIKGTKLHKSHDDPSDNQLVISIRFLDANSRRLGTGHVHADGTGSIKWR